MTAKRHKYLRFHRLYKHFTGRGPGIYPRTYVRFPYLPDFVVSIDTRVEIHYDVDGSDQNFGGDEDNDDPFQIFA